MFAVIYRGWLKKGKEQVYQDTWHLIARYFIEERGALGSCLHKTIDGLWIAYSRWPSKAMRDASWPGEQTPSDELPSVIKNCIEVIKDCIDPERKLPDIEMEVIDDQLLQ